MIQAPINATLPATGEAAVLVSLGSAQNCRDYAIQARGNVDMLISNLAAMTTYWTVKAGRAQALSEVLSPGTSLFYAVSGSTASVVEVLPLPQR
jgi:hypothetical protein